jgi:hypothetical protein
VTTAVRPQNTQASLYTAILCILSHGSDPETGWNGFSTRFPGQHPQHTIATFDTVDQVLAWCDPHRERIWEEASDADETKLLIARDFKEGTVGWRMVHLTLAELSAH